MTWQSVLGNIWMVGIFAWIIDDAFFKRKRLAKDFKKLADECIHEALKRMVDADITVIPESQKYRCKDGPEVNQ